MCSHDDALAMAKEIFKNSDPLILAENSGCSYDEKKKHFSVPYCRHEYFVSHPGGEIRGINHETVTGEEEVVILQYLNWSRGLPPRRKWISFLELPGGEMHFAPFQREAIFPLAEKFGLNTDNFKECSKKAGETMQAGDAAFIIPVFPLLELAIILWREDDEYPARANVLFDVTSSYHLPTASLYVLGIQVVKRLYNI